MDDVLFLMVKGPRGVRGKKIEIAHADELVALLRAMHVGECVADEHETAFGVFDVDPVGSLFHQRDEQTLE